MKHFVCDVNPGSDICLKYHSKLKKVIWFFQSNIYC